MKRNDLFSSDYHVELVNDQLHWLGEQTQELVSGVSSFGQKRFAKILLDTLEYIGKLFNAHVSSVSLPEDKIEVATTYQKRLEEIHDTFLPYLENTSGAFAPSEFLGILEDVQNRLSHEGNVRKTSVISLHPSWEYNFGFVGFPDMVDLLIEDLPTELFPIAKPEGKDVPNWFVFTTYPSFLSRNGLLHCNLAHEIGHLFMSEAKLGERLESSIVRNGLKRVDVEAYVSAEFGFKKGQRKDLVDTVYAECAKIVSQWLDEILCDLTAARLLGPSYLFAFVELTNMTGIMLEDSASHPASVFRLAFLLHHLAAMGYPAGIRSKRIKQVFANMRRVARGARKHKDPFRLVAGAIWASRKKIHDDLNSMLRGISYPVARFNRASNRLAKDLGSGIAISDTLDRRSGRPAHSQYEDILNAAWFVRLTSMQDFESVLSDQDHKSVVALGNLNELALKAVEAALVTREWQGH